VFDLSDEETDHTVSASLDVAIRNIAPTLAISGAARAGDEVPYGLTLGPVSDPGQDTVASFVVDWGDGIVETINRSPVAGETIFHTYINAAGPLTIRVLLIDEDGTHAANSLDIIVAGSGVGDDGVLRIYGTDENDVVHIKLKGNDRLEVKANFLADHKREFDLAQIQSIEVYLGDGNDHLHVHQKVLLPLTVYGEAGHDHLNAGDGPSRLYGGEGNDILHRGDGDDILLGGSGYDALFGDKGDDLLIGGGESDLLSGGQGDDLLIGGLVEFPIAEQPADALDAILAEWTSPRSYQEQVDNLSGQGDGERANGEYFLIPGETVLADHSIDLLFGGLGNDWLFWEFLNVCP
jgi:Ca2+-binding RTX toxin-like protein